MKFNIKNNSNFDKFQARKPEIKNQKNLLIDDDNDFILELPEIINEVKEQLELTTQPIKIIKYAHKTNQSTN